MKKLPVGLSDFKRVIEDNYYYVDKSLLIKELIDQGDQVLLLPRPRRFGKTLNLSMLRYFFEKPAQPLARQMALAGRATAPGRPGTDEDNSRLFRHLKIWRAGEEYTSRQGKYPVIYLTFKDVKEASWENALKKIKPLIQEEFLRHDYLRNGPSLKAEELEYFNGIAQLTTDQSAYENSLKNLSHYLARHHNQRVILLIDEYDTPIQAGYVNGYYAEVVGFMRNFLSAGLKDNSYLEKGVLTGIMRVAKESIFSGLNNLGVFTLLSRSFADKFGLTESEVKQMLQDFQAADRYQSVNEWYNGYVFGEVVIYNPWSIINYLNNLADGFKPYWLNTSDNAIVEQLLTRGGKELQTELESLIKGESIEKPVEENLVFKELERKEDLLWSFLLFGGYLKYLALRADNFDPAKMLCQLVIPNLEVRSIYINLVRQWFSSRMKERKLETMLQALINGDLATFEEFFAELVERVFSSLDPGGREAEKVYQAFAIGLLVWLGDRYEVKSNQESGYGRYDVMLMPKDRRLAGIIIEFKKVNKRRGETKENAFAKAFQQIEEKKYASALLERGIQQIRKLVIVFKGKQVWVKEQSAESGAKGEG
jgi:hypothetical protein